MQICKYASMQVCKYEPMQICKYAGIQVCKYSGMQVCKYAIMQVGKCTILHVCKNASMQVCRYMRVCRYAHYPLVVGKYSVQRGQVEYFPTMKHNSVIWRRGDKGGAHIRDGITELMIPVGLQRKKSNLSPPQCLPVVEEYSCQENDRTLNI